MLGFGFGVLGLKTKTAKQYQTINFVDCRPLKMRHMRGARFEPFERLEPFELWSIRSLR